MNQVGSTFAKPLWQSPLPDSSCWIVPLPFSSSLLCRLQSDLGPHLAASNSPLFPKFDPHLSMSNSRPLLAFATHAFVHELAETALCASYRQKRIETSFLGPILCFFALLETSYETAPAYCCEIHCDCEDSAAASVAGTICSPLRGFVILVDHHRDVCLTPVHHLCLPSVGLIAAGLDASSCLIFRTVRGLEKEAKFLCMCGMCSNHGGRHYCLPPSVVTPIIFDFVFFHFFIFFARILES